MAECNNCGNVWTYKGEYKKNKWVTCPVCMRKTPLDGDKKEEGVF